MKNPFHKEKTLKDKLTDVIQKPQKEKQKKVFLHKMQQFLLYLSIFIAGFIAAKLHSLFTKI